MILLDNAQFEELLLFLCNKCEVRSTIINSTVSGLIAASCGVVGGVLLGPPGIIAGTCSASCISYVFTKRKYKSLVTIWREDLSDKEQEELKRLIWNFLKSFDAENLVDIFLLLRNEILAKNLFEICYVFIMKRRFMS